MAFSDPSVRKHLKAFAFTDLFVEDLGWDHASVSFPVEVGGHTYALQSPVHKAGLHVFLCPPGPDGGIPEYNTRRRIEGKVAKSFAEHLIIFIDAARTTQVWQWMKREKDQPIRSREQTWYPTMQGPLVQKLQKLQFTLDEEEQGVSIVHSAGRTRDAFDVEKVTKTFYEAFRKEHGTFLGGIMGFPPPVPKKDGKKGETEPHPDLQWYTSLTLNRLMFVYFIQKKGFLDGDPDYLQNRLRTVRARKGKDKFHTFYRIFLLHLFHDGLGRQKVEREELLDAELLKLIGNVPYLNGGFFEVHHLERDYPEIDIPDKAFEQLFEFFDGWDWVLDTRVPRDLSEKEDRKDEINPDVVGYIFEKYINQKQMGAYYTKEDITGYITQNTVIPFILDRAAKECAVAFQPDGSAWKLLKEDPDRYIYEPVRRGVIDDKGKVIPLPPEIEAGINDIPKRAGWNKPAPTPFALPTETWREHVARRHRCLDLRDKLRKGEIHTVNDLITHNLDIRQFAQDIITNCDGPELLKAFWQPVRDVTVLDPTCGSGAFLFAALNLLEPLYSGCLDKMRAFLDEAERLNDLKRVARLGEFKKTLDTIAKHVNEDYFVLKSIIVNNLYGVDIMEEAVEICRLRLFLKLVSTVIEASQIEPLPDIDFNVRAGNTLVGYATKAQSQDNLNFGGATDRIEEKANTMELNWQKFRDAQTQLGLGAAFVRAMKAAILKPLGELREELDSLLAVAYGQAGKDKLPAFRKSHQPFHWWIEFYSIMNDGGFDVIVGNPPYKELRTVSTYEVLGLTTLPTKNLYPLVVERSLTVSGLGGKLGFIVPVSSISTEGYRTLQHLLFRHGGHFSSYDDRPSRLFDGLEHIRLSIHLIQHELTLPRPLFSTECYRWSTDERDTLFSGRIAYVKVQTGYLDCCLPKISRESEHAILKLLWQDKTTLAEQQQKAGAHAVNYSRKVQNFLQVLDFVPEVYDGSGRLRPPSEFKQIAFGKAEYAAITFCLLNSTLFRWFINVMSDFRHLNKREVDGFPINLNRAGSGQKSEWLTLARRLSARLRETAEFRNMRFEHDSLRVQCIIPKFSKDIIDEIDHKLGEHYGFSSDQTDFIVNYDVRYRLGVNNDSGED